MYKMFYISRGNANCTKFLLSVQIFSVNNFDIRQVSMVLQVEYFTRTVI
jgi:hypothetical protein